jgi:hypothetical protein
MALGQMYLASSCSVPSRLGSSRRAFQSKPNNCLRAANRDSELARRYDLVRQELAETIQLNEALGAPSARAMEKLFAAFDAEEASSARRRRGRISRTPPRATASILNSDAPARSAREQRLSE